MPNVQLPDNSVVQFPDEMPEADINSAIMQHLGGAEKSLGAPDNLSVEGIARNSVNSLKSFHQGLMDPLNAGAQMLVHAMPDSMQNATHDLMGDFAPTAPQFDQALSKAENAYQKDRQTQGSDGVDWNRAVGNIAGTAPLAMGTPSIASEGLLANMGIGALYGAGYGSLQPVNNADNDFASNKLSQMGIGAATGGAMSAGANVLGKMVSPKISDDVKTLMGAGVTPTPGQIMGGGWKSAEDKLTSVPLVGELIKGAQGRSIQDFNRSIYNQALAPIGKEVEGNVGREGVETVKTSLSNAYNELLPKLTFSADQQFADDLNNVTSMAQEMPDPQFVQFKKILTNNLLSRLSPQGTMDGQTMKGVESVLGQKAKGYLGSSDFDQRQLGSAIVEVQKSLRTTLQRANPQYAEQLSKINQGYANYAILRDAASRTGAENGIFTPAQFLSAVRGADKSVGKGNFATGNARMQDIADAAKSVLPNKYPESGTTGRSLMAGLFGLLAGGEGGAIVAGHPLAIPAMGAAALPYTRIGQNIAAGALSSRPAWAPAASTAINQLAPAVTAGVVPLALGSP